MSDIKSRIKCVLKEVFDDDIDEMAKCLDINRATVFRYGNGTIRPSKRSLNQLQERKGVSAKWMLKGGSTEIQYERKSQLSATNTHLPIFEKPVENINNTGHAVMSKMLATDTGKIGPNRYWLWIDTDKDFFLRGDFVLIETCLPRLASGLTLSKQYCILRRDDMLVFDKLCPVDVAATSSTKIVGVALSFQREIHDADFKF